jgi:hypothetical protein
MTVHPSLFRLLPICLLLLVGLTACDEDSADDALAPSEFTADQLAVATEVLATLPPDTASSTNGTDREGRRRRAERCLQFVFPVSLVTAEGETVTFEESESLREFIVTTKPIRAATRIVYPVQVTTVDGDLLTLENRQDLREARRSCAGDREPRERCFRIDYPVDVLVNGDTVTVANPRQLRRAFVRQGERTEANIIYPLSVTDLSDGSTRAIADAEAFRALKAECE